ncbi:hypothetical protein M0R45_008180 [Rubus argutus]|uniref:Uncharacterized protein n=1 Tax=Rubus argutus TaxID=59490 RepID=A0AAW1Y0H5_RUBAR
MELTENSMEVDTLAGEGLENIFPEDGGDCFGRLKENTSIGLKCVRSSAKLHECQSNSGTGSSPIGNEPLSRVVVSEVEKKRKSRGFPIGGKGRCKAGQISVETKKRQMPMVHLCNKLGFEICFTVGSKGKQGKSGGLALSWRSGVDITSFSSSPFTWSNGRTWEKLDKSFLDHQEGGSLRDNSE